MTRQPLGATGGYAYTAREWDPEAGLYYYRARYYDPEIGRFIREDPIGFLGGVNFYAYVENAPTNLRDPFGLSAAVGMVMRIIHWVNHPPKNPVDVWQDAVDRTRSRTAEDFVTDPSNWVNHCVLNCELEGDSWPGVGPALAGASDYVVVTGWPPPGFTPETDPEDRQANACGRWAGRRGRNCRTFCEGMWYGRSPK